VDLEINNNNASIVQYPDKHEQPRQQPKNSIHFGKPQIPSQPITCHNMLSRAPV